MKPRGALVLVVSVALAAIALVGGRGVGVTAAPDPNAGVAPAFKMPVPPLPYGAREGQALFHHYCATCHGDEGQGDGLNAYNLDPKPRDLSDPAFQRKRSDDDLAGVIRSGGGVAGLSTGMPPWGRTLGERRIRNIVTFLRTLKAAAP
ncbi:MAG: c-type cytochrome [Acidobacteria bacterium]|nr:c-type cytochrome [Acidobacteriota bacterium]